jgi:amino acid adenylation domain-containing protein
MSLLSQSIAQEYWIKKIGNSSPVALFHSTEKLNDVQSSYRNVSFPIPSSGLEWVQKISGGEMLNQHLIYLTALGILLSRYSNEREVIVMTPDFAWEGKKAQQGIQFYFKILIKPEYSFKELLYKMLEEFNEILDHYNYQSDALEQRFGSSQTSEALRQFSFSYDGFNIEKINVEKTDLAIVISKDDQERYFIKLTASSAEYEELQLNQLGQDYLLLLNLLSKYPDKPLGSLQLLSIEQEQAFLEAHENHFQNVPQKSLITLFEEQVKAHPKRPALQFNSETLTYQELNERANALAYYLTTEAQTKAKEPVAVMLRRSSATVIALLGILKAGRAFLPVDPDFPAKRKQYILEDAAVQLLITDSGFMLEIGEFYQASIFAIDIQLDEFMLKEGDFENLDHSIDDLAYILYTSGSTGTPKGVKVAHASIANYISWANDYYFQNKNDKPFAFCTSITFDLTLTSFFSSLTRGDMLVIIEEKDIEATLREVFTMPVVRSVKLTPSHISLLQEMNLDTTSIDTVILGGEALQQKQVAILRELNPEIRIFNEYGPTETTVGCMVKEISKNMEDITIGHAVANTGIYIVDENNCILPEGVVGELAVSGIGLAKGYLGKKELTEERFVNITFNSNDKLIPVYKTGDLAFTLSNNETQYLGRIDNQVKINGHRIEMEEIRRAVSDHRQVVQTCVVCRENEEKRQFVIAYYVSDDMLTEQDLRQYLVSYLPGYMVPAFCVKINKIPLTSNGKIDEKALPLPESMTGIGNYEEPTTTLEKNLVAIWQEVLEVKRIGVSDDFFLLGGDSIKAIRICNKIQKTLGETVEITTLFEALTIKELAHRLSTGSSLSPDAKEDGLMPIEPIPKAAYYEVSSAQKRIWISSQLKESQLSFNICSWRLLEGIDVSALEMAFKALIDRYEILRTVFIEIDGHPKQKLQEVKDYCTIQHLDVRDHPDKEKKVMELAELEGKTSFDLEKGPLLRAKLIQMEENKYVLLFSIHHIISDGWTMDILFKEMTALYESYLIHGENLFPPPKIQYKDFAAWESSQLSGERLKFHRDYWLNHFKGKLPTIKLPTDYPRPTILTYSGTSTALTLNSDLSDALKKMAKEHNSTLFTVMLTLLYTLMHRYSNQKDMIVGSPFLGRGRAELENQVGIFINLLPIRVQLAPEGETFVGLLEKVKHNLLMAHKHQVYPFERIVKDLSLKKDPGRSPLFDVLFSFQTPSLMTGLTEEDILKLQKEDIMTENSKYDLTLIFTEYEKGIFGSIKYNRNLFKKDTINLFKARLIETIESVIAEPKMRLDEIEFSSGILHNNDSESFINENFSTKF